MLTCISIHRHIIQDTYTHTHTLLHILPNIYEHTYKKTFKKKTVPSYTHIYAPIAHFIHS